MPLRAYPETSQLAAQRLLSFPLATRSGGEG